MKKIKNLNYIIFIVFFILYLSIGIMLSCNIKSTENYDFFFGSDVPRIVTDFTVIDANHSDRIDVHPLYVIMIQPLVYIINLFCHNLNLALILLEALIGAGNVIIVKKILEKFNLNNIVTNLFSLIYGISFSSLIFSAIPEVYVFSAFMLLVSLYYVINVQNIELSIKNYIMLILLGIGNFGLTITNIIPYGIMLLFLYINQRKNKKMFFFSNLFIVGIVVVLLTIGLACVQSVIWDGTNNFFTSIFNTIFKKEEYKEFIYTDSSFSLKKILNIFGVFFCKSLIGSSTKLTVNKNISLYIYLSFKDYNVFLLIFTSLVGLGVLYLTVRYFVKNKLSNLNLLMLIACLLENLALHMFYGVNETFLYTQHFVFLIVIIGGITLSDLKNEQIIKYTSLIFGLFEILFNIIAMISVFKNALSVFDCNFGVLNYIRTILFSSFAVGLTVYIYELCKNKITKKHLIILILVVYAFSLTYIYISQKDINVNIKGDYDIYSVKFGEKLKEIYPEEINEFNNYRAQFDEFCNEYKVQKYNLYENISYFIFGMGNREKYLYKNGVLKNLFTEEEICSFNIEHEAIIPNMYTVLIEDEEGNTYRIYENDEGIFIEKNLENINTLSSEYLSLFTFENQKYVNIKKVLYNEILINVKDGKLYPNVIVYDNVWYRDLALAGMVLKNTNNLDLIKDYILNLDYCYDLQNKGMEETDNLGQVLYLISLVSDKNHPLVSKIIEEASKYTVTNENGKYLDGSTDYSSQPTYETDFYKLGLEKLGIENDYNYNENVEGSYLYISWWNNKKAEEKYSLMFYNTSFPYLTWGYRHATGKGNVFINSNLYPLSWEANASEANYSNMKLIDENFVKNNFSPSHVWTASEILLYMLDEEGILNF